MFYTNSVINARGDSSNNLGTKSSPDAHSENLQLIWKELFEYPDGSDC